MGAKSLPPSPSPSPSGGSRAMRVKNQHFLWAAPVLAILMLTGVVLKEQRREVSLNLRLGSAQDTIRRLEHQVVQLQAEKKSLQPAPKKGAQGAWAAGYVEVVHGVLPSGHEVGEPRDVYVSEAITLCKKLKGCTGFTFSHAEAEPNVTVPVYFKSACQVDQGNKEWWTYVVRSVYPTYPQLKDQRALITADYDYEAIAKFGPESELDVWPEFRTPVSPLLRAFSYPGPEAGGIPVSVAPRVYIFPGSITPEDSQEIVDVSAAKLQRSLVARGTHDKNKSEKDDVRTSSGAWLDDSTAAVSRLRDLIEAKTGVPRARFEMMQILRYEEGQKYGSHVDYFHPGAYGKQSWNRMATVITFLNNVTVGGESSFPLAHNTRSGSKQGHAHDCDRGLKVKPVAGTSVLFYSMRPNYNFDPFSLHSGCPVGKGEVKWVSIQWLRLDLPPEGPQPRN